MPLSALCSWLRNITGKPQRIDMTAPVSRKEVAAVEKYVEEFQGPLRIRIALLAAAGVGKPAITDRLHSNSFREDYFDPIPDDGFDMCRKVGGEEVWYYGMALAPYYDVTDYPRGYLSPYVELRHVEACIFAYDVTSRASFDDMKRYYDHFVIERSRDARKSCTKGCLPVCKRRVQPFRGLTYVIGNKIDRPEHEWEVSRAEAEELSTSIGATLIFMSAKTGEGCTYDTLQNMTMRILLRRIQVLKADPESGLDVTAATQYDGRVDRNARFWY